MMTPPCTLGLNLVIRLPLQLWFLFFLDGLLLSGSLRHGYMIKAATSKTWSFPCSEALLSEFRMKQQD